MDHGNADLSMLLATDLDRNFKHLVIAYQPRLYAFALRQTGSPQDAEDIVQEAFMQAYYALGDYPDARVRTLALRPWLYKITLNIFYSRMRKSRLQCVSLDTSEDGPHLEIEDSWREQPDVMLENRESLCELEAHVAQLPAQHRDAVNLYYFEGLSYQEITDLLNVPMGTVKSNLHRGIRQLRKALAEAQTNKGVR
jgi:RNA polymerase sigma-70 factor (ECF subfamily)